MLGLATKIKQRNIQIITVGVGYGIDEEELKEIASDPSKYISAKEFDELLDVLTGIFASLEKLSDEQKNADELNFNANKDDKLILNNGEYIGSDSNKDGNSANSTKKGDDQKSGTDFPYMNPIIVNIQSKNKIS
ncbi:hypothetical protein MXB_553 [Myxobolus squamalis]|nr:hypothetical protein MXB_553 [Myxobolus squamalis]